MKKFSKQYGISYKKKENYFIEYGEMNLGIRYSRGLNGLIKLKK